MTKLLHVIGTTTSSLVLLWRPSTAAALLTGAQSHCPISHAFVSPTAATAIGFMACEALAGLSNGAVEALIMLAVYSLVNLATQRALVWQPLVIGVRRGATAVEHRLGGLMPRA